VFNTSRTSALTATGRTPASRLTRDTSLSAIHVLMSVSSRVNSANTSSKARFAAGSSPVHAVSVSVEPMERREAVTVLAGLKSCATDDGVSTGDAVSTDDGVSGAHARQSASVMSATILMKIRLSSH
jgi:hypothetical protein